MSSRTIIALAFIGVFVATAAVAAEPTDEDRAIAQDAFGKGMSERARGDLVASLASFERAHARLPSPITGLELGRAYMLVGRLVAARRELDAVVRSAPKPSESVVAQRARKEAVELRAEVDARMPKITVAITGARAVSLTIDGDVVAIDGGEVAHSVDPGRHHVVALHAGLTSDRVVDVAEGDRRTVTFVFDSSGVSSFSDARVRSPSPAATTWAYGALIVGGIGVGVGSVAGIVALSDRSTLQCNAGRCPATQAGVDSLNRAATISTISFAVGLVGAGLGIYGLLSGPSSIEPPKGAHVEPWIGLGSIGLSGSF
ncbi:MAG: tol-pal system YbgF family protein [Polyangiales bacterium]